jgi:hypothetical protein
MTMTKINVRHFSYTNEDDFLVFTLQLSSSSLISIREQMIKDREIFIFSSSRSLVVGVSKMREKSSFTYILGGKPRTFGQSTTFIEDGSKALSSVSSIRLGSISRIILRSSSIPTLTLICVIS